MSTKKYNLTKKEKRSILIIIIIVVVLITATILLFPFFKNLTIAENRESLISSIREKGAWGVCILLGLQLLQVVIAVIPGEVIEVAAGILYGTFWGYIICTIGVLLSSMLVFYTVRRLGASFVERMISSEKMQKLTFLNNTSKLEVLIFLLFFIPGTPKDILTYFVPLTKVRPLHFFLITTLARIPSIISSTYAGSSLGQGKFAVSIAVFAITAVLALIGIFINKKFMNKVNNSKS